MCTEDSAYVMQEVCKENMRCNRWTGEKTGVLAVGSCEYGCADPNMTWVRQSFTTTSTTTTLSPMYNTVSNDTTEPEEDNAEEDENREIHDVRKIVLEQNPPHLCYNGQCNVYLQYMERLRIPLSLTAPEPPTDNVTADSNWCTYRTAGPSKCLVPPERLADIMKDDEECTPAVRCQVLDPYDEPDGVLADAECRLVIGDPAATFWTYLFIRILADIWPTAGLALLGAACVIATRETSLGRGDVGRQLAFGTLGLAIFPPLAGLAIDQMPENPYLVPFVMHAVFMLIGALILLLDRTLMELNGTAPATAVGLTLPAGALPAVPALFWAEALVDYIGHSNVFITAFIFYGVRYTGLAYTSDYSWVLVCEILEVFTLSLVWVTAMLYFRHLVPRKYTATGQALPVIAHFCIGPCIGAIVSGMTPLERTSTRLDYLSLGICALILAAVYFAVYYSLRPRFAAPAVSPPQHLLQGLNANGTSNGTYSPMRVYHEERSRKGQFRY
ncbi:hypothetical protein O3G_MSEX014216 [Manduca sexta]|uniref:Major facilitator superfamily associated domain-containing protein n=1 Tax=Manduca sexta TaxID=7130 RepID=A0A921ZT91_MANSE|nr:hypothetical protein O3G_MSEX014216 [Manduca sexta]